MPLEVFFLPPRPEDPQDLAAHVEVVVRSGALAGLRFVGLRVYRTTDGQERFYLTFSLGQAEGPPEVRAKLLEMWLAFRRGERVRV